MEENGTRGFDQIPIIDLSSLHSPRKEDRVHLARQIDKACTEVGFFYIRNHGIPELLIGDAFAKAENFFAASEEQKMKYYMGNTTNFRGYSPLYGEKSTQTELMEPGQNAPPGSLSEGFDVGYELSMDPSQQCRQPESLPSDTYGLLGDNLWPDDEAFPGFRDAYCRYLSRVIDLARSLMRLFALALDQREDFFDEMVKFPGFTSRLLHYPPQPVPGENIPGLAAHVDYEMFTILAQGDVPALEVRNPQGKWVLAPPIADTLIVNISDSLSFWTNKRYKSTIHRVTNLTGQERYSIPFFFGVDYNTTISVLENQISADRPPCKEEFKFGEYVRARLANAYIGYGGEPAGKD